MTSSREFLKRTAAVVLIILAVGLAVYGISRVFNLLELFFTAWVIAVTLEVPVVWMQRIKIPRLVAVILSILILLGLGAAFIAVVIPLFVEQIDALITGLPDTVRDAARNYIQFRSSYLLPQRTLPPLTMTEVNALLDGDLTLVPVFLGMENLELDLGQIANTALPVLREIGSFIASALANLFLIVLLALLILLEPLVFYRAIVDVTPRRYEARAVEILNMVRHNVTRWLGAMLISMAITTVLFLIVLGGILRLPNALALSLLAGLATFIPTFGPTIALIPIAVIATAEGVQKLVITVILYALVGTVQDRVITPMIMRTELNIPPALLVVTQLALAVLIGPLGLLLAVPILAIVITLVRELYVVDALGKSPGNPKTPLVELSNGELAFSAPAGNTSPEDAEAT